MPRVMVIGLDGATFRLLTPWMEAGKLPHLRAIRDRGVWGTLESTIPPVTAPAWQCFMSGKNPGKHGVHFFQVRKPGSYDQIPVFATSFNERTLWEQLSDNGARVLVLNVPFTYPPPKVNGVLISGFTTPPSESKHCCYPAELLPELEAKFGAYPLQLGTRPALLGNQEAESLDLLLQDCRAMTDYHFRVAQFLMQRDEYDFVMFYLLTTDRIQHWWWHAMDPDSPSSHGETNAPMYHKLLAYYQELDAHIGRLSAQAGEDCQVLVMSDHGFGPLNRAIDLNVWLLNEGYIRLKKRVVSRLKRALWRAGWTPALLVGAFAKRLLKFQRVRRKLHGAIRARSTLKTRAAFEAKVNALFLSQNDIDWSRTTAYCCNAYGQIRINLEGREPEGCVKPGKEYEALRDEIAAKLAALRDPDRDQAVNGRVYQSQDIYWGRYAQELPDITFLPLEQGYTAGHAVGFVDNKVFTQLPQENGGHRMDGILLARGNCFKTGGAIDGANIMDVAPTVLHLMGNQVPTDMDGRVLEEVLDKAFLHHHPIEYCDPVSEDRQATFEMSQEDQDKILSRLKGLGYID